MSKAAPGVRYAECERETNETRITVVLDLDGVGEEGRLAVVPDRRAAEVGRASCRERVWTVV